MLKIDAIGLKEIRRTLDALAKGQATAQQRAVNYAARKARTEASRRIRAQINLPANYLNQNKRLYVSRWATRDKIEAVITARQRPTRLARYGGRQLTRSAPGALGDPLRGIGAGRAQHGVSVRVKTGGKLRRIRRAFLLPLRQGKMPGDKSLMGMFVRTGKSRKAIRHLYGPSVDQVFRRVRGELRPQILQDLEYEYSRQLRLLTARILK